MASSAEPIDRPLPSKKMSAQTSYAVENSLDTIPHGCYGTMMTCLGSTMGALGSLPCCCCCPNPYKQIPQGFVGMVSRFGKFYKSVDPGLVYVTPLVESLTRVDVKIQIAEIPQQTIMTKDNVSVNIDSVLYWHIIDPYQAVFGVADVRKALIERTQTTLRHTLGGRVLQHCIEFREAISQEIAEIIEPAAQLWGIKVESILIKDIQFSRELQESLSSAAQQKRIGESKVIAAQAEVESAKLMAQAADILASPAAMQLRYLETMTTMAKQSGTRVIFMPYTPENNQRFSTQDAMVYGQVANS